MPIYRPQPACFLQAQVQYPKKQLLWRKQAKRYKKLVPYSTHPPMPDKGASTKTGHGGSILSKVAPRMEGKGEREPPPAPGPWKVLVVGDSWLLQQCQHPFRVWVLEPELTLQKLAEVLGPFTSRDRRQLHFKFPSLRANRPFKPLQRRHICPTVVIFSSSPVVQEIRHLPMYCQMPQTPSKCCWQTRPMFQILFRPEPRPEGSPVCPTTSKLASKAPLAPMDFQAETHLCSQFRGFAVRGKAGVAMSSAQGSRAVEDRGKAELRNPRQED